MKDQQNHRPRTRAPVVAVVHMSLGGFAGAGDATDKTGSNDAFVLAVAA